MSYAMTAPPVLAGYSGFGAYDPTVAPVFEGCTINTTKGRTKWPPGWACNKANYLAARAANNALFPANASQTILNENLPAFFDGIIAGKIPVPAGFPSPNAAPPPPPAPPAPTPVGPEVNVAPSLPPPAPSNVKSPSLVASFTTGQSSTLRYAIIGGGALLLVGLVLKKARK